MELIGYRQAEPEQLDAMFAALADPTRRSILSRLAVADATVTELAEPFDISQPAISKHLKVLERAGLISRSRDAQRRPCRLEVETFLAASDWFEGYRKSLQQRFDRLDAVLQDMKKSRSNTEREDAER